MNAPYAREENNDDLAFSEGEDNIDNYTECRLMLGNNKKDHAPSAG